MAATITFKSSDRDFIFEIRRLQSDTVSVQSVGIEVKSFGAPVELLVTLASVPVVVAFLKQLLVLQSTYLEVQTKKAKLQNTIVKGQQKRAKAQIRADKHADKQAKSEMRALLKQLQSTIEIQADEDVEDEDNGPEDQDANN